MSEADKLLENVHTILSTADATNGDRSHLRATTHCESAIQVNATAGFLRSFLNTGKLDFPHKFEMYEDHINYLMGLISAVRELERYSILRAQQLDHKSVRICLAVV